MRRQLPVWLEWLALTLGCLTLVWGPLAQGSTFGWGMSGLVFLGCLTLAATLLALASRGYVQIANPRWVGAAAAFSVWVWVSTSWAADQWEAFRWAGIWMAVMGTAVSLHVLATSRRRQIAILTVMVLTGMVALAIAYLQTRSIFVPGFKHYPGTGPTLITGPYFNPSHFSGFLISVAGLITSLTLFTRLHAHTLVLLGLLVALHAMNLKTDSSSIPAVLLATGLPLLVWVWTKSRLLGAFLVIASATIALAISFLFLQPSGQQWFATHQEQLGINRDWNSFVGQRQATWRYAREIWKDHPFTGIGIGQFPIESPQYRVPERGINQSIDRQNVNYAHNDSLQLLAEVGGFGLTIALGLLSLPFVNQTKNLARLTWHAVLPATLFAGIYDAHVTAIPGSSLIFFVLAGLAARY